jgi:hypothetical protein
MNSRIIYYFWPLFKDLVQRMKIQVILILLLGCAVVANAQPNWSWSVSNGGADNDLNYAITTDAAGNVYSTGYFRQTVDFDPGVAVANHTSLGYWDVFVQKLNSNGDFVWAKTFGAADSTESAGRSITTDNNGNLYTTGSFGGTVDFDPNAGVFISSTNGYHDVFVTKLDTAGAFIWAKTIGGPGADVSKDIIVDNSGNVYVTGFYNGTVDFDPNSGVTNLSSMGGMDVFIQKLDASGNLLWAKSIGGTGSEDGHSMSLDAAGNISLTGIFQGTVDFDPGAGTANLISNGDYDSFLLKLDAAGDYIWAKSFGGTEADIAYSVDTDQLNNMYVSGIFKDTADFDPDAGSYLLSSNGNFDFFIQKLDQNGDFIWAKAMGGPGMDGCYSSAIDSLGNVYLTGQFNDTVDFDPNAGITNMTTSGFDDAFLQKIDPNGDLGWVKTIGGNNSLDVGNAVATDLFGGIYVTGSFNGTADLDPETGTLNHTTSGLYDFFIIKMQDSPIGFEALTAKLPIAIYPNPVSGTLYIESSQLKVQSVNIFDMLGNLLRTMEVKTNAIDVHDLSSGMYFIEVVTAKGNATQKLIKQ